MFDGLSQGNIDELVLLQHIGKRSLVDFSELFNGGVVFLGDIGEADILKDGLADDVAGVALGFCGSVGAGGRSGGGSLVVNAFEGVIDVYGRNRRIRTRSGCGGGSGNALSVILFRSDYGRRARDHQFLTDLETAARCFVEVVRLEQVNNFDFVVSGNKVA